MAIHFNMVMGKLSHGGLISFPKVMHRTRVISQWLMPGSKTREHTGEREAEVTLFKGASSHTVTEGSKMVPLSVLVIFCCVSRNK